MQLASLELTQVPLCSCDTCSTHQYTRLASHAWHHTPGIPLVRLDWLANYTPLEQLLPQTYINLGTNPNPDPNPKHNLVFTNRFRFWRAPVFLNTGLRTHLGF